MGQTFHILGDGLAGLLLARRLRAEGAGALVCGNGRTNTPPVGLVHLFAGRTFRRDALELLAFEKAVEFWRAEPLANEYPVSRQLVGGDRLQRSLRDLQLPAAYTPRLSENEGWVEYQPGFAVASQQLEGRLRRELEVEASTLSRDIESLPRPRVLAAGHATPELLPEVVWDVLEGRTVEARPRILPSRITIGRGVHVAPRPGGATVVIGGRSSPKGGAEDETALARELLGEQLEEKGVWRGTRCAPACDRRPVMGHTERGFAFCGFGSRALFWLPLCLDLAAGALLRDEPIPPELNCRRLGGSASGDGSLAL